MKLLGDFTFHDKREYAPVALRGGWITIGHWPNGDVVAARHITWLEPDKCMLFESTEFDFFHTFPPEDFFRRPVR